MKQNLCLLITGGAGFIGSHLTRWLVHRYPSYAIHVVDALTYAGHIENLADVKEKPNYHFHHLDICAQSDIEQLIGKIDVDAVIHLAAESHVDRSIDAPLAFLHTNVLGTAHLLEAVRKHWQWHKRWHRFYQISTDEVYGELGRQGHFTKDSPYRPRSPYSASKAAADHLVHAYAATYGLPTLISHCTNNYGPYQFPEKLIPQSLLNLLAGTIVPIYGRGEQRRDWVFVEDHVRAIDDILHKGQIGETYHIGGDNEHSNRELVEILAKIVSERTKKPLKSLIALLREVQDRPGHDFRYAVDTSRIQQQIGWKPQTNLQEGLARTLDWYRHADKWIKAVKQNAQERT